MNIQNLKFVEFLINISLNGKCVDIFSEKEFVNYLIDNITYLIINLFSIQTCWNCFSLKIMINLFWLNIKILQEK